MKAKKRNCLFLLLPCFMLAGFGYWQQRRNSEPFRLVAESITVQPAPQNVQRQGFDTEVILTIKPEGAWPDWLLSDEDRSLRGGALWETYARVFDVQHGKYRRVQGMNAAGTQLFGTQLYNSWTRRVVTSSFVNMKAAPQGAKHVVCQVEVTLSRYSSLRHPKMVQVMRLVKEAPLRP